ncbi:P-loop NTPase fold protein [Citrobacter youngae]|uniref:P-loop NTPase fold protein n=1 Tax=Citrobacter youngae TaxID=133448 RepID=UPI0019033C6D|nr:P-loop NTPase fold protein [Citrobacter youngae]EAW8170517.1 ATP-binding protein [Salmonella enterica]EDQ6089985.1 ATP-binding protein [Salmonella enterica]MBJ8958097.1 ATP-binding protein [Citrobacter youngae]HDC1355476.1 ATP-binding protein [Salmonella enterica]HDC1357124.1 ATP-binding protein [Salmonella enterica]
MSKDELISNLIRLLSEPRDGLILINGDWGVGKTYFLQNEFKEFYTTKTLFYMSVLGLNSLQDFKDRIVNITYLDDGVGVDKIKALASNAAVAIAQDENVGKLADKMMSAFSGAMKDYVLKDLQGIFVIDDLERISQELRDEIATFCLQRYQDDNRLDYILVGNFSDQSSQILNHKEKVVSDEIHFSLDNFSDFLDGKLKNISNHDKVLISQVIIGFEVTNLRIINRVINKLLPLINSSLWNSDIKTADITNLVSSLCAHIILKEDFAYQSDEFYNRFISSSLKTLVSDDKKGTDTISKRENELLNITAYKSFNGLMAQYCFNIISHQDILPFIFTKNTPLQKKDYADLLYPEQFDISEEDYCEEIRDVILKASSPTLSTWLIATKNYLRLSKLKYIPEIKGLTKNKIEKIKLSFSDLEIEKYFRDSFNNIDSLPLHVITRDDDEFHNFFVGKYIEITKNKKIESIKVKMCKDGWGAVDVEIQQSDFKYNIFEMLGVEEIVDGVKMSWSIQDIKLFTNHISALYSFLNLSDYLSGELPYLNKLLITLVPFERKMKRSFRRGAIIELNQALAKAKELLEASIARSAPQEN